MRGVDFGGDRLAGILLAARDHHAGALRGQPFGDGAADPAARSGDDRDFS